MFDPPTFFGGEFRCCPRRAAKTSRRRDAGANGRAGPLHGAYLLIPAEGQVPFGDGVSILNDQVKWPQIRKTAGHDVHVLRANLPCLSCHLPSLHSLKPKTEDCVKCHNQARTNIGGMAGFHCTACHQFLAGNESGLEPKREVCLTCHSAMKLKGETFPDNAPMRFECAACHKPHSQPILKFNDCLGCHPQVAGDRKHFERDLTQCVFCHRPHVWKARVWTAGKEN